VTLSSIGLPGLNGFVGEVLVLVGTYTQNRMFAAVAATGMILGAVYMLWMYQRVFLGKVTQPANLEMPDLCMREKLILIPIFVMMLWIGVFSAPFLRRMDASIQLVQDRLQHARGPEGGFRVQMINSFPGKAGLR
jgi:NADH-quinone oxidoreductase subunit M